MKRILLSLSLLLASGSALAVGSTGAFFSDVETSAGNVFTAGAIDLKIDNTSYYNGTANPGTSWASTNLTNQKFFDFGDVKPGDTGEDTISLHVDNNDSYLCANVTLTSNKDNDCTEPELADDPSCGTGDANANGELASNVNFVWWADDGDNVLETGENVISSGPIGALTIGQPFRFPLADSGTNIWNPASAGGPLAGGTTKYIGKAWCFGTLTPSPLAQDGLGVNSPRTPANSTGGITCNGTLLNNSTQTDSLTADVEFDAVQARHNDGFQCVRQTKLTLVKNVVNTGGGTHNANEWTISAAGPTPISGTTGSASVTNAVVTPGQYTLSETGPAGYSSTGWSCVVNGGAPVANALVTLAQGDQATCTITNTFQQAKLTVTKIVVNNNGGNETVSSFQLFVDNGVTTTGVTSGVQATLPPGTYGVSEIGVNGYQAAYSGDCNASGVVTLAVNDVKACTITNTELPAHITLIKNVTGTPPLASNTLFNLTVDGISTPTGASVAVTSNTPHAINEGGRVGYTFVNITGSPKCPAVLGGTATLDEGEAITCTITNNKNP